MSAWSEKHTRWYWWHRVTMETTWNQPTAKPEPDVDVIDLTDQQQPVSYSARGAATTGPGAAAPATNAGAGASTTTSASAAAGAGSNPGATGSGHAPTSRQLAPNAGNAAQVDPLPSPLQWIRTIDAKKLFCLETADLAELPCQLSGGGLGCGAPKKWYQCTDLHRAANAKHGSEGFMQKRQARFKRAQNKRKRDDAAKNVAAANHARLVTVSGQPAAVAEDKAAAATAVKLRRSLLKLAKRGMGFKDSGAPRDIRVEVPGVGAATFAHLCGVPSDPTLATLVKQGAYYSVRIDAGKLFGKTADLSRFFAHDGVAQELGASITLKYKPSTMSLTLHAWADVCMS